MTVLAAEENRRTETPNAVMTTHASPSLGSTDGLSLWRVEMQAGAQGPPHAFDSEQIWTVLAGKATLMLGDDTVQLVAGDTVVLPAGAVRRFTADEHFEAIVAGHGSAVVRVPGEQDDRGTPPWIA
jgi:quercetin dioxygenase-like cupin family protein